jgi:predicted ATPase
MAGGISAIRHTRRLRAYALGFVTAAIFVIFALAESLTERYVSAHSRLAGTTIELAIVALAALAFRPLHRRIEQFVEAALTKRRREARAALARLQKELTSFSDAQQLLGRVIDAVDTHMSTAGSAAYLWRGAYAPEASSFETSLDSVAQHDPLAIRLRSSSQPADPRPLGSAAAGDLAFPMMARGELVGFLTLTPKRIDYETEDLHALSALTEAAGLTLVTLDSELRLHDVPRTNLPQTATSFVGREREITEIKTSLQENRLVTLIGAGGVGKTRTALQLGSELVNEFDDGVWLAEFGPIADTALVAATILRALNLPQSPSRTPLDVIVGYLKRKTLLLVLDNCEHVIDETRPVASAILSACPSVRILATSREPLHVAGEQQYRMPSLGVPAPTTGALPAEEVLTFDAARLFADRAFAVDRRFALTDDNAPHVAEICRRLDGIPLAIELAAARVKILAPQQLAQKLDERFRVLTGGDRSALPRHQTMRALIDWSYDLLSEQEQTLFRKLSIFAGGCTLQTATAVCGDGKDELARLEHLSSLVDKSLLQAEPSEAGTRYELLESTRQYARERLAEHGEELAVTRAHAIAFLALAEELDRAFDTTPDRAWEAQTEPELENWRAALAWGLGARHDVAVGRRLAGALWRMWGSFAPAEGREWVRLAAQTVDADTDEAIVAALELAEAMLDIMLSHHRASFAAAERALGRYRRLGDERGVLAAQDEAGFALLLLNRVADGEALLQATLVAANRLGLQKMTGTILRELALARTLAGDIDGARARFAEARPIATATGADRQLAAIAFLRAELEFSAGDALSAVRLVNEALDAHRSYHDPNRVVALNNSAAYLVALGRYDEARSRAREALSLGRDLQLEVRVVWALQHLAAVAGLRPSDEAARASDDRTRATRLLGYVDSRLATLDLARDYTEQQEYDKLLAALRDALGDDEVPKLMSEGAGWTEDHAISEAMLV